MLKNYFTSALRNFLKHKSFTFLNVAGLSLGLAASLLILQFVKYERSFDAFHAKADDIYRIQYNGYQNGKLNFECAAAVPAVGPALKNNFPEVLKFTRLYPESGVISYESPNGLVSFREQKMQVTDPAVFDVFDFPLLMGNPVTALAGPNRMVISESAASRYFGKDDPMGKTLRLDGRDRFEVTGVMKDLPANSHIKFNFMISYETLNRQATGDNGVESENSWGWYDFNTYVLLRPGTDVTQLQHKWDAWLEQHQGEAWKKNNYRQEFILKPLKQIHLYAKLLQESEPQEAGDANSVYSLSIIAFFILVIAWVNYINLATARSFERANEVGVRKVMGAHQPQLIAQFLIEAFLVNLLASVIALVVVRLAWPYFSLLSGRNIPLNYLLQRDFVLLWGGLFLVGAALSGFYPAIILSSFRPISVLKGKIIRSTQGNLLRKSLVIFQFVASVVLISGSVIVYQQLNFMKNQNLGVNIARTLVIKGPGITDSTYLRNLESFKTEVLRISGVKSMTVSNSIPGNEIFWTNGVRRITGGPKNSLTTYHAGIDYDYVPAYELKLAAGRNYDVKASGDRKRVIINRALADALEFKDPSSALGEKLRDGGDTLEIVGVLENYHQMSLKNPVVPIIFILRPISTAFYSFKLENANPGDVVSAIEKEWKVTFAGNPMDYFYLDQFFNKQYESDRQFGQVFALFTLLAIFIACMGLFGLASFMTIQRTKEIGIRKVLGSSVSGIMLLLSKGFIQLVLIANLIAWPLAWYVMNRWLQGFPYHITINPLLFFIAGAGVVVIAFASVGFQTFKAARINPARTLKYE